MNLKVDKNIHFKLTKNMCKNLFLEKLMELRCNKLGNEDQHMF
jgi:hypothetical protein